MIDELTPPGTPLVVVWRPESVEDVLSQMCPEYREGCRVRPGWRVDDQMRIGTRVVLDRIVPCAFLLDGFGAALVGRPGVYLLKSLDIAELPSVLTKLLVPVLEDA